MNCQDFEAIIIGIARAQLLQAFARNQALAHIAQCAACAERLAEQQALTAAVRATARKLAGAEASPAVEQALRAAFRAELVAGTAPAVGLAPTQTWQWPRRLGFAAAAVLLIAFFAGKYGQQSRADRKPALATTSPAFTPAVPPGPDNWPEHRSTPAAAVPVNQRQVAFKSQQTRATGRRGARNGARNGVMNEDEIISGFIALAEEGELAPLESGQVLRVELPASTLLSMGLPIPADDVSKPMLADLLLGQDGLARAIRFVKPGAATDTGAPQTATNR